MLEENDQLPRESRPSTVRKSGRLRRVFGPTLRVFAGTQITINFPFEVSAILTDLMNQTDHDAEEVFIKSIYLYKAAVDAEKSGKKMVILDADGDIDQEITGL